MPMSQSLNQTELTEERQISKTDIRLRVIGVRAPIRAIDYLSLGCAARLQFKSNRFILFYG